MNSRTFMLITAVLALLGLIVNVGFDLDNVYDMTTSTLFGLVFIVALVGAYVGMKKQ